MPFKASDLGRAIVAVAMYAPVSMNGVILAEQPYQVEWIAQIGSESGDISFSVALDGAGNAYISGQTTGSLGGPWIGYHDAFLAKFDPSGQELWSRQFGSPYSDYGRSVAVDVQGNAFVTGYTGGDYVGPSEGSLDAFLTKFDPSGAELWRRQIGSETYDESYSVVTDSLGNAYISGSTLGNLGGINAGHYDSFVTKFDASGDVLWTQQIGTPEYDHSLSVDVDDSGNIYISGYIDDSIDGPYSGTRYAFLTKLDSSGAELWTRETTRADWSESWGVAVDGAGNAYISGRTRGDIGGPNAGDRDAFLMKFDPSGSELWSRQIGTSAKDDSLSLAVDSLGNAFISGVTQGDLGGLNSGRSDAFLAKYDPSGIHLWSQQIGTDDIDSSHAVALDNLGNAYISGYTSGSFDGPKIGYEHAFLAKFTVPEPTALMPFLFSGLALIRRNRRT